jgi:hypothetical protein
MLPWVAGIILLALVTDCGKKPEPGASGVEPWEESLAGVSLNKAEWTPVLRSGDVVAGVDTLRTTNGWNLLRVHRSGGFGADERTLVYMDLDGNPATGRVGQGNEVMLEWRDGHVFVQPHEGFDVGSDVQVLGLAKEGTLYLAFRGIPGFPESGGVMRMKLVFDRLNPLAPLGTTGWVKLTVPPETAVADHGHVGEAGVRRISKLAVVDRLLGGHDGAVIEAGTLVREGFVLDHSEYRKPSVIRPSANRARLKIPAKRLPDTPFHVGIIYHDAAGAERFELVAGERLLATIDGRQDDGRQHAVFSEVEVAPGDAETIEVRAVGPSGWHRVEAVLLAKQLPEADEIAIEAQRIRMTTHGVAWTTTRPARCEVEMEFEGGQRGRFPAGQQTMNHRLASASWPAVPVRFRISGVAADGAKFAGDWMSWRVDGPERVEKMAAAGEVALLIVRPAGEQAVPWPARGGIPFVAGAVFDESSVAIVNATGDVIASETEVLSRWPDGSIKWLLVTFVVSAGEDETAYRLKYGGKHQDRVPPADIEVNGLALGNLTVTPAVGHAASGPVLLQNIGKDGPVSRHYAGSGMIGEYPFQWQATGWHFEGTPWTRVQLTIVNAWDETDFVGIRSLSWRIPGAGGEPLRVRQVRDDAVRRWTDAGEQGNLANERLAGVGGTVRLRDFWKLYPKGLDVTADQATIWILPPLDVADYEASRGTVDEHRLYFWLAEVDGGAAYRLKQGMALTTEIWLGENGKVPPYDAPFLVAAEPEWYAASGAAGELGLAKGEGSGIAARYEKEMHRMLDRYLADREETRAYGFLNHGDWWGERKINWGNTEYDTAHGMLLHFMRTGDPKFFDLGDAAARHFRDIDIIHHHRDPKLLGKAYLHSIGHVGGYYEQSPGPGGTPEAIFDVGHSWTAGLVDHYWLTGDARSLETAKKLADNYNTYYLNGYDFTNTRVPGWHLLLTLAVYRATGDPFYLNAAHIIVDRVLERQTLQSEGKLAGGGWSRVLVPGHCRCETAHRGNAGFMVAVLLNGLREYYEITGDPRVKASMERAAEFLVDDMWVPDEKGFRYTSCPASAVGSWSNLSIFEGLGFVARSTKDSELREKLAGVIKAGTGPGFADVKTAQMGKEISFYLRAMPRVLESLTAFEKEEAIEAGNKQ